MKKIYFSFIILLYSVIIQAQEPYTCPSIPINGNITIPTGETCTYGDDFIILDVSKLTVSGELLLPEGYYMNSGVLEITQKGNVRITGDFFLTNSEKGGGEVINGGFLEVFDGKFEMRATYSPQPKSSAYFTNKNGGAFNLKNTEFIIGQQQDNSGGGALFYNEEGSIVHIDNSEQPEKKVWIGGRKPNGDESINNAVLLSPSNRNLSAEAQKNGDFNDFHTFPLFDLDKNSFFNVVGTDVNMVLAQGGNIQQNLDGELYVRDANLDISYQNNSGGQNILINGGLYVLDSDPFDDDKKGMVYLHAQGGDLEFIVNGNMYVTGLELPNDLYSGSNSVTVESGATVFIGNVGASAPSDNYKVHVKNGGTLYYCGNYSGGGDVIGWVDEGGSLFYAENYYNYGYHNTDENRPDNVSNILYNGPIMNYWRLNEDNTRLTNINTNEYYDLYNDNNTPYFIINETNEHSVNVSIYIGEEQKIDTIVVTSGWYFDGNVLKNYNEQNIPFFNHEVGINGDGEQNGIKMQLRTYSGSQEMKTVVWYEINSNGEITIYSDIDDFSVDPNAISAPMEGVETNYECAEKFLTPPPYEEPPGFGFLPVSLSNFEAILTPNCGSKILWTTQTETNNDYFTLYRSYNGVMFDIITTIDGAGTTTVHQYYEYIDNDFVEDIVYYKLGQTDYNGEKTMSNIIIIKNSYLSTFEIESLKKNGDGNYTISLLFPNIEEENNIVIYDSFSNIISKYKFNGNNKFSEIDVYFKTKGIYIIEHINDNRKTIKKIIIN